MMLKTGSNSCQAFTLLEVMVAAAVLSLGAVLIHEAYFISLDAYNYYANYVKTAPWMDELIWQAEDNLRQSGNLGQTPQNGELANAGSNTAWDLSFAPLDIQDLYRIDSGLEWQAGKRKVRLTRSAYALYEKE